MNMKEIEDKIQALIEQNNIEALNNLYKNLLLKPNSPIFETVACIKKIIDMELSYKGRKNG